MQFKVRSASSDDLRNVDQLFERSYNKLLKPDCPPSVLVLAIPLIARAQPRLLASDSYFVAETSTGEIIGAGGWTLHGPMGEAAKGIGHIRHFATDPDHLKKGVGRGIMMACIDQAKTRGISRLTCMSTRSAVAFYQALGFDGAREVVIPLRPGIEFPAVCMERPI